MKFKVITGYESTPKIHLAMERGEVHGTFANWSTLKAIAPDWLKDKQIRLLAQWDLKPHPEMTGVPMFLDVAKTEADKQALRLALARLEFGRPFFMPPNVPADRVAAIRRAFDATMKDKGFLEDAEKLKIEVDPLTRRSGGGPGGPTSPHAGRCRRARAHGDGEQVALICDERRRVLGGRSEPSFRADQFSSDVV